jgi:hypothetical protein
VVVVLRRPGCIMCRSQAALLWEKKSEFDQLGVKLACVVNQALPAEVEAFAKDFWPGEIYLDESKGFYAAVGEGKIRKGSLWALLNPFGKVWKNAFKSKKVVGKNHNTVGDGTILGGLVVVTTKGTSVPFAFQEKAFGDAADVQDVLGAAAKL